MPYVRLSEEEKARRKAMRDEVRAQNRVIGKAPSQKKIDSQLQKAKLELLKMEEKQRVRQAKQELLQQKAALKEARKQAKDIKKYNIATQRSLRQQNKEERIRMKPAEKSVMKSDFVGPLLPTQRRKRTYARRNLENIAPVAPARRGRGRPRNNPAPVPPARVVAIPRVRAPRLPVRDSVPVVDNLNVRVYPPIPPAPPLRIPRGRPRNVPAIV